MRTSLQPAYLLHRRPYRDTSQLLELLCLEYGRIGVVARGTRRLHRGGSTGALLQPFRPLLVSFGGRSELKTLSAVEPGGELEPLHGDSLLSGFYLNELLVRTVQRGEPHPSLFAAYAAALAAIASATPTDIACCLRRFEFTLLDTLGYGIAFDQVALSGDPVRVGQYYVFVPGEGVQPVSSAVSARAVAAMSGAPPVAGEHLLALASGEFGGHVAAVAKRVSRAALAELLGPQPLLSRALFRRRRRQPGNVA